MDRLIYTAMSGAKAALTRQEMAANNLANVSTPGFRAETRAFMTVPVAGSTTRALVDDLATGADFTPAAIQRTGRDLDVAIEGRGWLSVEASDGSEAYTRAGALVVDANGILTTSSGRPVLSDGGPISVSPDARIAVSRDGTVSATPPGKGGTPTPVARLKLVNPEERDIVRGDDGLFRLRGGEPALRDDAVVLTPGALEGSNVNPVEALVGMIALARQYDLQMKLLTGEEQNARQASQLLNVTA
ncbi:MAG: flagellar basal body rod protein FlgF [Betaproteobacteria bacterium]|nr:flagellar basal body rod protein FlgF [Betaproteobacteria bacterium]